MIERHIDYIKKDEDGHPLRSVHLLTNFVRHYLKRDDGALPTIGRAEAALIAAYGARNSALVVTSPAPDTASAVTSIVSRRP